MTSSSDNNSTDQTQHSYPSKIYYDRESIDRVVEMLHQAVMSTVALRERKGKLYISAMKRAARIAYNEDNKTLVETIRRYIHKYIDELDTTFNGFYFDDDETETD